MSGEEYAYNKKTNRYVKIGSRTYNRGLKAGDIITIEEKQIEDSKKTNNDDNMTEYDDNLEIEQNIDDTINQCQNSQISKKGKNINNNLEIELKTELKQIVNDNEDKFCGISQEQTDELLKKMLYDKLFKSKKTKTKPKQQKKNKFRIFRQVIESDSDSE